MCIVLNFNKLNLDLNPHQETIANHNLFAIKFELCMP